MGKKLNVQGLSRKNSSQQKCLIADEGRVFVFSDLCFPTRTTEFLTKSGWKYEPNILDGEEIWQVNPETLIGSWTVPKRRISYNYTGKMISYESIRGVLTVTEGHKMLWVGQVNHPTRKDKALWRHVTYAGRGELKSVQHIAHFTHSDVVSYHSEEDIWKVCLLQADGSIAKGGNSAYKIEVSKPRKREKITELFGKGKVAETIRPSQTMKNERWYVNYSHPLLNGKIFNLSSLGENQADCFVEALAFWDGSVPAQSKRTGRIKYCTTEKRNAEEVQQYLVRSGYECRIAHIPSKDETRKDIYNLSIRKLGVTRWSTNSHIAPSGKISLSKERTIACQNVPVSCFEVDSGFLLVRQGGQTFVSGNCAAEPTVTAHYSKDPNYLNCTLHMVGKRPYYDSKEMLVIDDIYLCVASRFPKWKEDIRRAFESYYNGVQGYDQWLINPETISKGVLKKIRGYAKIIALALAYGLGPKKMVLIAQQNGFELTASEAKTFKNLYWSTFSLVKSLGDKLISTYHSTGVLQNDFGYCLYPDSDYKVLNALIQSTVSGIMDLFNVLFFTKCPEAWYVVVIHDEIVFSIPEDKLDTVRSVFNECVTELNKILGWDVPIRFGWEVSKTFDIGK